MFLKKKKYQKIIELKKKINFCDFDLITNYGLFSGDTNLFKTVTIFDLIKQVSKVKGDVIELGIHRGNTSLLIKKLLSIFKIKKKLYLLDHFKGLIHYGKKDTRSSKKFKGQYIGEKKEIKLFLKFFNFKNVKFIDKDATTLKPGFFANKKFCLAYFDMDLYEPTIKGLEAINKNMTVGSFIVFDEGHKKLWSEKLAIKEFIKRHKNFKKIVIDKQVGRQPDVILKKIRSS